MHVKKFYSLKNHMIVGGPFEAPKTLIWREDGILTIGTFIARVSRKVLPRFLELRMKFSIAALGLAMGLACGASTPASAYVFGFSGPDQGNLLTTDQGTAAVQVTGWYDSSTIDLGSHSASNTNYIVGQNEGTPTDGSVFHDFFVFDISGLSSGITTATFTVQTWTVDTSFDNANQVTYSLYDVSTPISTLEADQTGQLGIWQDLASGNLYGQYNFSNSDSNSYVRIGLDGAALADLNAAIEAGDQTFAIGGTLQPVATPEPLTLSLFGAGLAGLVAMRRGKNQPKSVK